MERHFWSRRQGKMIERSLCLTCWQKANLRRPKQKPKGALTDNTKDGKYNKPGEDASALLMDHRNNRHMDEANALLIGGMEEVIPSRSESLTQDAIMLDHHIFDSKQGWREAESMHHPVLKLRLTTDDSDYFHMGAECPRIATSHIEVVTDTGAQSCLWSRDKFLQCSFHTSDLIPVKRTMRAANREKIQIDGEILIRLSGTDNVGRTHTAPVMAYVSPDTQKFYLSREALIQLGIISKDFPQIGATMEACAATKQELAACGCPNRMLPPERPPTLPFHCTADNNTRMKEWLIDTFSASTFNKCLHQKLPGMTGPHIRLHIDPQATPVGVHTPSVVPLHWQVVEKQIRDDVAMGVLEEVPFGESSLWCHRMVVTRKADGGPRRTVDLSPLDKHCLRETHHVKPPYQQAKSIPSNTWKSVTDAWNGYHSVPIHPDDRHLTGCEIRICKRFAIF